MPANQDAYVDDRNKSKTGGGGNWTDQFGGYDEKDNNAGGNNNGGNNGGNNNGGGDDGAGNAGTEQPVGDGGNPQTGDNGHDDHDNHDDDDDNSRKRAEGRRHSPKPTTLEEPHRRGLQHDEPETDKRGLDEVEVIRARQNDPISRRLAKRERAQGNLDRAVIDSAGSYEDGIDKVFGKPAWPMDRSRKEAAGKVRAAMSQMSGDGIRGKAVIAPLEVASLTAVSQIHETLRNEPTGTYTLQPGETLQSIAQRMGIPVEELIRLNGMTLTGYHNVPLGQTIVIPIPGWQMTGPDTFWNGRTLGSNFLSSGDLEKWWNGLSLTEKRIEFALSATSGSTSALFHNYYSFNSSTQWLDKNQESINAIANDFGLDPSTLKVMLLSERVYDYEALDYIQDSVFLGGIIDGPMVSLIHRMWQGTGVANVHYPTLYASYIHASQTFNRNPWKYSGFSQQGDGIVVPNTLAPDLPNPANGQVPDQFAVAIARYTATDEGTIRAAAMVTKMLVDQYVEGTGRDPNNLTAADMAVIFSAYRTGIGKDDSGNDLGYPDLNAFQDALENYAKAGKLGDNVQLALPLAEYLLTNQ